MTIKTSFPADFQQWILDKIPLLSPMEVCFDHYEPGKLVVSCPLAANINDKGTGFGGSIVSLATLCGWIFTMIQARASVDNPEAVIVEQSMKFIAPVTGRFTATCQAEVPDDFHHRLKDGRPGKLSLTIEVMSEGIKAAHYEGFYLASAH